MENTARTVIPSVWTAGQESIRVGHPTRIEGSQVVSSSNSSNVVRGNLTCVTKMTTGAIIAPGVIVTTMRTEEAKTAVAVALVEVAGVEARITVGIDQTEVEEAARKKGTLAQGINQVRTEALIATE